VHRLKENSLEILVRRQIRHFLQQIINTDIIINEDLDGYAIAGIKQLSQRHVIGWVTEFIFYLELLRASTVLIFTG
jgi:hypothetical protein